MCVWIPSFTFSMFLLMCGLWGSKQTFLCILINMYVRMHGGGENPRLHFFIFLSIFACIFSASWYDVPNIPVECCCFCSFFFFLSKIKQGSYFVGSVILLVIPYLINLARANAWMLKCMVGLSSTTQYGVFLFSYSDFLTMQLFSMWSKWVPKRVFNALSFCVMR